jgi:hypothetical protein
MNNTEVIRGKTEAIAKTATSRTPEQNRVSAKWLSLARVWAARHGMEMLEWYINKTLLFVVSHTQEGR